MALGPAARTELDLLTVREPGGADGGRTSAEEREQLEALRRLASILGAQLLVEEGDDVAEVAIRVARERGSTYVLANGDAQATQRVAAPDPAGAALPPAARPARRGPAHRGRPHAARRAAGS